MSKKDLEKPETKTEATPDFSLEKAIEASLEKLRQAVAQVPKEQIEKAQAEITAFMKDEPEWADASRYTPEAIQEITELGYEQFKLAQYERCEKIFRGLTILNPGNDYYHQMLGATYQRQDRLAEAILEYSVALDLNPKDITSHTNRGEIYFKLQIYELAREDFEAAIALDPSDEDPWGNRSRMLREQIRLIDQKETGEE